MNTWLVNLFLFFFSIAMWAQTIPIITPNSATAIKTTEAQSFDAKHYEQYMNSRYTLFTHERNYFLPISYVANPTKDLYPTAKAFEPNNQNKYYSNTEAEFQISFFLPLLRKISIFGSDWDLLFSYTHHAWWQLYNGAWSRPFRETNYTPEIFIRQIDPNSNYDIFGLKALGYDLGYVHESNGQIQILSRSWNRLFARAYLVSDQAALILNAWMKTPETSSDDNADIQIYKGLGSIEFQKTFGPHTVEVEFPMAAKPGVELRYSYPWKEGLRWFVDIKYGYGQSLIEYDIETKRIALGFTLENFLDKKD